MPCTTLLVGKKASYDGSTMIARDHDSGSGSFDPKKFVVVQPEDQPRVYTSKISHLTISLPDPPMRYTALPNVIPDNGIWGGSGVNELNVSMTATETLTSNERVLGADPLVVYQPASGSTSEVPGGIGEEDMLTLVLPYMRSAREGVQLLGSYLERYGTYEMNGIAFSDLEEIWWLETIGGHHWIARRVPDEAYVVMPNWFGIDDFDLEDAMGEQMDHMCSPDLPEFIEKNHLDLTLEGGFNARLAFGSHSDADHTYNTPRAWFVQRYFNPRSFTWDGPMADFRPDDDDLPWAMVPERKITVEDVKYALSGTYQGTPYDPYGKDEGSTVRGLLRPIGINRNNFLSVVQLRPYTGEANRAVEWLAFGSNAFNALVPFYANINAAPEYMANTGAEVSTDSFYWNNRLIAALADAHYRSCANLIERYQLSVQSRGHALINRFDKLFGLDLPYDDGASLCEEANQAIADMLKKETADTLAAVLHEASNHMKNAFSRSDA